MAAALYLTPAGAMAAVTEHADTVIQVRGVARALDGGPVLYVEERKESWHAGRRVRVEIVFRDPRAQVIATKTVRFADGAGAPDYVLEDRRLGRIEQVERRGRHGVLRRRLGGSGQVREKEFPWQPALVVDIGLEEFVRANWQALDAGQVAEFSIPAAQHLTLVACRLARQASAEFDADRYLVVRLVPRSRFFRWFAPRVELVFERATRRLRAYRGISELRDPAGATQRIAIDYATVTVDAP